MRRLAVLPLLLAACLLGPAAPAGAQVQGCAAASPPTPATPGSCTHQLAGDGVYAGHGSWVLEVVRAGETVVLSSASAPATGPLRLGDVVTARATAPGSAIAVSRAVSVTGSTGSVRCTGAAYGRPGPDGTDPLRDRQWALDALRVPAAWAAGGSQGGGVLVAVVDTGVDLQHPDLRGRLVAGADLWEARPGGTPDCPGPQDEQGHGTMVAGVVAAGAGNGVGVVGVAPAAKVLPVRVRPVVDSTDFSRVADGIRLAADRGARVIALTGGVKVPLRPAPVLAEAIAEAVEHAWARGAVVVATAGNDGLPWCQYPAASPRAVCAAATGRDGAPASYSSSPFRLDGGLAVRAPGGSRDGRTCSPDDVVSTAPPGGLGDGCGLAGWGTDSGTTYATAHTAGVAALLAAQGLGPAQVVACLAESGAGATTPLDGAGSIDALRAVGCAVRARRR